MVASLVMAVIDHARLRSVRDIESYCEANLNESYCEAKFSGGCRFGGGGDRPRTRQVAVVVQSKEKAGQDRGKSQERSGRAEGKDSSLMCPFVCLCP